MKTLKCIIQQLNIDEHQWPIELIEQIYNENIEIFNKKVIKKCGIIIGYRYRPYETVFRINSNKSYYINNNHVRAFNASSSYTCYPAYIFICFYIIYLIKIFIEFLFSFIQMISSPILS